MESAFTTGITKGILSCMKDVPSVGKAMCLIEFIRSSSSGSCTESLSGVQTNSFELVRITVSSSLSSVTWTTKLVSSSYTLVMTGIFKSWSPSGIYDAGSYIPVCVALSVDGEVLFL